MSTVPAATPITPSGVLVSGALSTAAALTNTFQNDGRTVLAIQNGSASPITATEVSQSTVPDGGAAALTVQDRTVTIAAGATRLLGPFPTAIYNDANQDATITLDAITTVTVQAFRLTPVA